MNLRLTNTEGNYDLSKWTVDLSGLRFRNSYNDRFGKPGQERQGDGNESARTISFAYSIDAETDSAWITAANLLYGALRKELAPFYIEDTTNERRLLVTPDEIDLSPRAGTELRSAPARLRFTALDTFWESTTETTVDSPSAGTENQDTLTCDNPGNVVVYPVITMTCDEPNSNFALYNETTDDVLAIGSNSFVPGATLEIDCQNGTVYLTNINTRTEISSAIGDGTGFLHLVPGENIIRYESGFGSVNIEIVYRRRWAF